MSEPAASAKRATAGGQETRVHRAGSDWPFFLVLGGIGSSYVLLILALLVADLAYTSPGHFAAAVAKPEIRYAIRLTLVSCTISAILSVWVATPLGYLLSRFTFRGRWLIDTLIDIPIVLPPLVIGLSLLILFHLPLPGGNLEQYLQKWTGLRITYAEPAVVLRNSRWPVRSPCRRCGSRSTKSTCAPSKSRSRWVVARAKRFFK